MGLHLYCVVPADTALAPIKGIDAAPLCAVTFEDIACWASELDHRAEPTVPRIREHNAVVEAAISDSHTPVPIRFGQWVHSRDELLRKLADQAPHFRNALILFAGALEFGVRVLDPDRPPAQIVPPGPVSSGRDYLAALKEQMKAREIEPALLALQQRMERECGARIRAARVEQQPTSHGMLTVSHLVSRSDFDAYRACVQALRDAHPRLRFLVSGPWPPYSFAV